jgi:hypothetical protein
LIGLEMVKKKIGAEVSPVAASHEPVPALAEATGAADRGVQAYLLDLTFASTMPGARSLSKEEQVKQIAVLVELLRSMGPQDAMESLLTSQMVAVYSAAMDCLRRAAAFDGAGSKPATCAKACGALRTADGNARQTPGQGPAKGHG